MPMREGSGAEEEPLRAVDAAVALDPVLREASMRKEDDEGLSSAIKACAHSRDVQKAEELLLRLEEDGSELCVDAYNAVIHTCTQAGDTARAVAYVCRMQEKGFEPNLVTFNSMINACAVLGDTFMAEKWLLHMVERGIQPNHVTYGTVCKVFARKGGVQQVEGIMKSMEENGLPLNEYFFASLISACGAASPPDPARAERALADLVRRGLRPQSVRRAVAQVIGKKRAARLLEGLGRAAVGAAGEEPLPAQSPGIVS